LSFNYLGFVCFHLQLIFGRPETSFLENNFLLWSDIQTFNPPSGTDYLKTALTHGPSRRFPNYFFLLYNQYFFQLAIELDLLRQLDERDVIGDGDRVPVRMNDGLVGGDDQPMRFVAQRNVMTSGVNLPTEMSKPIESELF